MNETDDQEHLPRQRRGRGALIGELIAHPLKDSFGAGLAARDPHRHGAVRSPVSRIRARSAR